jgi:hypothetical protein
MGEPAHPNLGLVSTLHQPFHPVDMKQFRVNGALIKAEEQLFHALFGLTLFHGVLGLREKSPASLTIIGTHKAKSTNIFGCRP